MMKVHSCLVQCRLVIPHKSRVPQNLMKIPKKLRLSEIVGPNSKLCICKVHTRVWTLQIQSALLEATYLKALLYVYLISNVSRLHATPQPMSLYLHHDLCFFRISKECKQNPRVHNESGQGDIEFA